MVQLTLENKINESQMSILLHLLQSWNIEAKVENMEDSKTVLPFSIGMWADYDIDDKTLREKAWGTHKRLKYACWRT